MKNQKYKSFDDLPLMLTVIDVAEVLGISRTGAYELVRQEGFPALNIGKRIVIPKEEFVRWIRNNTAGNATRDDVS
jgi:excisionase family DNA binding protein